MPTATEAAAARRAKILARSQKGNSVKAAGDIDEGTPLVYGSSVNGEKKDSMQPLFPSSSTSLGASAAASATTASSSTATHFSADASDKILEEAEKEIFSPASTAFLPPAPSDGAGAEDSVSRERPLARRLRLIEERKAKALAVEAEKRMKLDFENENVYGDESPRKQKSRDGDEDDLPLPGLPDWAQEKEQPVKFVSSSTRAVEAEIAALTKKSDDDVLGKSAEKISKGDDLSPSKSPSKDDNNDGDESSNAGGDSPRKVRSVRQKFLEKMATKKEDKVTTEEVSASSPVKTAERAQQLAQLAASKHSDPSAFPRIMRILVLITLALFSGYTSFSQNSTDINSLIYKRSVAQQAWVPLAAGAAESTTEDANIDSFFDEEDPSVAASLGWLSSISGFAQTKIEQSPLGPYYEVAQKKLASENSDFNKQVVDTLYIPAFHRRSIDTFTDSEKEMGLHQLGDGSSTEGCSSSWGRTTIVAVFGAWILGTITSNILKPKATIGNPEEKKNSWVNIIWNFMTSETSIFEYLQEIFFGFCGEFALFWLFSFLAASSLAWYAQQTGPEFGQCIGDQCPV